MKTPGEHLTSVEYLSLVGVSIHSSTPRQKAVSPVFWCRQSSQISSVHVFPKHVSCFLETKTLEFWVQSSPLIHLVGHMQFKSFSHITGKSIYSLYRILSSECCLRSWTSKEFAGSGIRIVSTSPPSWLKYCKSTVAAGEPSYNCTIRKTPCSAVPSLK